MINFLIVSEGLREIDRIDAAGARAGKDVYHETCPDCSVVVVRNNFKRIGTFVFDLFCQHPFPSRRVSFISFDLLSVILDLRDIVLVTLQQVLIRNQVAQLPVHALSPIDGFSRQRRRIPQAVPLNRRRRTDQAVEFLSNAVDVDRE